MSSRPESPWARRSGEGVRKRPGPGRPTAHRCAARPWLPSGARPVPLACSLPKPGLTFASMPSQGASLIALGRWVMLRSILVPVDGSSFGEHALPMAVSLARKAGATLHLVHVHQVVPPTNIAGVAVMDTLELHRRQDEQAYLSDLARRVAEGRSLSLETALIEGDVAPALQEHARAKGIGLMVLSTHGRGALSRFW